MLKKRFIGALFKIIPTKNGTAAPEMKIFKPKNIKN